MAYVTVNLPIDTSLLKGRKPGIQTVACTYWDASSGMFSSDGCVPVDMQYIPTEYLK